MRLLAVGLGLAFGLGLVASVRAQPAPARTSTETRGLPPAEPLLSAAEVGTEEDLRRTLDRRARFQRAGDTINAEVELANLLELAESLQIQNAPLVSSVLLADASRAVEAGDHERAVVLADAAVELSPDLAQAHFARARTILGYNPFELGSALTSVQGGLRAATSSFRNRVVLGHSLLAILLITIYVLAFVVAVTQLASRFRYLVHDLARGLPEWVTELHTAAGLLLVLFAPLLLGLGLLTTLALWLAVPLAYRTPRERGVSVAMVVLLAASPYVLDRLAPYLSVYGTLTDDLATAAGEAFSDASEARLLAAAKGEKVDHDIAVVLGARARRRGDLAAAELWYTRALRARSSSPIARNNLGRLQYLARRPELALESFKKAASARAYAEPLLNLASMLVDDNRLEEAKTNIDQARALDPVLTSQYTSLGAGVKTAAKLLDVPFDEALLFARLEGASDPRVVAELWHKIGGRTPPEYASLVALALGALGLALAQRSKKLRMSAPCVRCGRPADAQIAERHCDQCRTIYLRGTNVDPATRAKKEANIRRYQLRLEWTERLLSPIAGVSDLLRGRPIVGVIVLAIVALGGVTVVCLDQLFFHPWFRGGRPPPLVVLAILALPLALVLRSAHQSFRR